MENLELLFTNNQECSCLDGVCHLHKTYMQRTPQPRVSCPGRRDGPEVGVEEDEIRHTIGTLHCGIDVSIWNSYCNFLSSTAGHLRNKQHKV